MSVSSTSSSTSKPSTTPTSTDTSNKAEKTKTTTPDKSTTDKAAAKATTPTTTPTADPAASPTRATPTPEEAARTRSDLEHARTRDVQASFRRAQLDASVPAGTKALDTGKATPTVDQLSGTPPVVADTATPPVTAEALREPVKLADPAAADYTRVDAYAERLAAEAPDPTYHQGDYVTGMADALSGRVPELGDLSDAERTRLMDHAYEQFGRSPDNTGDAYAASMLGQVDPAAQSFVADDMADRAMALTDRVRAAEGNPDLAPADVSPLIDRAQTFATEAALHNAEDPAAFLDRLGPDASRFADALHVDRGAPPPSETTQVAARLMYEGAANADPSVRDAFRNTLESRATGQPENPVEAEAWRRLSGLDPATLGQADLRAADQLLRDNPPRDNGAAILGADHPAVVASTALEERQPRLSERLAEENAVYARAGFTDDQPFAAGTAEERAAFITDAAGRIDTLSPRAADQALEAIRLQREAGVEVPAELEAQLGRRLMISSGVDLAARLDHQMDTAMASRGIIGEGWDGLRNTLGLESGSDAVTGQLDRLRAARDELTALQDFQGTDAELSEALATRLDNLQQVAQDTSQAVSGFIEQQDGLSTRGLGLLQAVGGGLETVAGVGLLAAPEPLSKVAGVAAVAVGVDDLQAGTRALLSGEHVPTFRAQLAEEAALAAGASPELAAGIAMGADLAPAGIALARGVYRQSARLFATARGADALADAAPLTDNFTDLMARPREAANAVRGTRFTGGVADDAIAGLEAQGIRVVQNADARLDAISKSAPGRGPLGGFDHETGEVLLRANPTYYEWFHESAHARQWLELGKEGYQSQSVLAREAHVYNEIMANAGQFNRPELRHAQNYIQRLADTEAHALMASGRYTTSREVFDVLRAQGVPEDVLLRIPRELFGYNPR